MPKKVFLQPKGSMYRKVMSEYIKYRLSHDFYGQDLCEQLTDDFSQYRYFSGDLEYDFW